MGDRFARLMISEIAEPSKHGSARRHAAVVETGCVDLTARLRGNGPVSGTAWRLLPTEHAISGAPDDEPGSGGPSDDGPAGHGRAGSPALRGTRNRTPCWDLLKVMTGAGPMTIREAARRMERDVKGVHADVHTLLKAGLLRKTGDERIVFPYDVVHVDFTLRAA